MIASVAKMLAIQQNNSVSWAHQDPVTKSQRITSGSGTVTSTIDLDPWGGETSRSSNQAFQPQRYTTYTRDSNGGDDAMMRRYGSSQTRFSQPDPYDGSYSLTDPQSFNRYAYTQNDPVNFIDPTGLEFCVWRVEVTNLEGEIRILARRECYLRDGGGSGGGPGGGPGPDTRGGGPGGQLRPQPRRPQQSYAARVAACCARCFHEGRFDNVIRDVGKMTGHSDIGEFVADLTVLGTVAAIGNEVLNATSLGRYPRGGVSGTRAGSPTTWQHTVGGRAARSSRIRALNFVGKLAGRVATKASIAFVAFEAAYTQGQAQACVVACTANPSSF